MIVCSRLLKHHQVLKRFHRGVLECLPIRCKVLIEILIPVALHMFWLQEQSLNPTIYSLECFWREHPCAPMESISRISSLLESGVHTFNFPVRQLSATITDDEDSSRPDPRCSTGSQVLADEYEDFSTRPNQEITRQSE